MDGLVVCRLLKGEARTRIIPVIMLIAKGEEAGIVNGLELGPDDYLPKPFSPRGSCWPGSGRPCGARWPNV